MKASNMAQVPKKLIDEMLRNGADLQDILKQVVMYDQTKGQLILQLSPKGQQIMNQS